MSAAAAARAMAHGVRRGHPDAVVRLLPLSDGGPGLLDALLGSSDRGGGAGLSVMRTTVEDPLGRPVEGRLLMLEDGSRRVAAAESADACGLHLLAPGERDPTDTGTEGVGDLIQAAGEVGVGRLILGLGGSATCDGGTGAARRLGWSFEDARGRPLDRGGGSLEELERIRPPATSDEERFGVPMPELVVLADVRNPLLGERGAARTFGPQKGASAAGVRCLEAGLARLASLSPRPHLRDRAGAGAAGGLAFGCAAFLGARIVPGSRWVLERVGMARRLESADLVVTGEGAFDETSSMGKVTDTVIRSARRASVPVVLGCGRIDGPLPRGVTGGDGEGERLDADGLAALTARLVERAVEAVER